MKWVDLGKWIFFAEADGENSVLSNAIVMMFDSQRVKKKRKTKTPSFTDMFTDPMVLLLYVCMCLCITPSSTVRYGTVQ